ncbi:hypothetical protein Brsp02_02898 [Brucella sp. NBRC 113783]
MEEHSVSQILESLSKLIPATERVDNLFNSRLLEAYPDIYRVFAADIDPAERSLMQTLTVMLCEVRHFGSIRVTVRALTGTHKICRLIDTYYEALAETLVWTLRRSLGDCFTAEMERIWWEALYTTHQADCGKPVVEARHFQRPLSAADEPSIFVAPRAGWFQSESR